jgi:hypothetical protein
MSLARYLFVLLAFVVGVVVGVAGYARLGPDAARLDAGVQAALLLLVSVTVAASIGAGGAIAGSSIAAGASERAALSARNAEDRHRFTDSKQALYVEMWIACDRHRREVAARVAWLDEKALEIEGARPQVNPTEPARLALKAIELLAPAQVATAAASLYQANVELDGLIWWDPNYHAGPPDEPIPRAQWARASEDWQIAADAFLAAAKEDLRNPS